MGFIYFSKLKALPLESDNSLIRQKRVPLRLQVLGHEMRDSWSEHDFSRGTELKLAFVEQCHFLWLSSLATSKGLVKRTRLFAPPSVIPKSSPRRVLLRLLFTS